MPSSLASRACAVLGFVRRSLSIGRGGQVEQAVVLVASGVVFAWASAPANRWLVDDAGISYAYGMNWARRGELGVNPEAWAAEGFSNPMTVAVVALLTVLRLFHPLRTPHALATALFGLEGLMAFRILRAGLPTPRWVSYAGTALFVALEVCTPSTMIWYGSGLENGQLSFAILVLLRRFQRGVANGFEPFIDAPVLLGVCLVRAEAPLFAATWLGAALIAVASAGGGDSAARPSPWRGLIGTAALTVVLVALAAAARWRLFASTVPNTFYAKVGRVDVVHNFDTYVRPVLGEYWYSFGLSFSVVGLLASVRLRPMALPVSMLLVAALGLPLVGGSDWMGQHRFGTAFVMLGHFGFAGACAAAWAQVCGRRWLLPLQHALPAVLPAAGVIGLFARGRDEYRAFLREKYVGYAMIADDEGFERIRIQRYLGLSYPVVALPDAGGSTVVGDMQLVDTAYLTDFHMARLRDDAALVTQYEVEERRVDLAEHHAWAFDRSLVGSRFLPAAKFDAERDYVNFFPAYAVRRDLVELNEPDAGSTRLGGNAGLDVYLSGRTVAIGAPGAVLRVELLVAAREGWDAACDIGVSVGGSSETRKVFTLSPLTQSPIAPVTGRYYRQGYLVHLPTVPAEYPLRVDVCPGRGGSTFEVPRSVSVRPSTSLTAQRLREQLGSGGSVLDSARWVTQLREQLVARLAPEERGRLREAFRVSYRDADRTSLAAYDALIADSEPAFLKPMPGAVKELDEEVRARAAAVAAAYWAAQGFEVGSRTLAVGRLVDDLRRLGFLEITVDPHWASLIDEVVDSDAPPRAKADTNDAYARALGLALIFPGRAAYQTRLAAARRKGMALPMVAEPPGQSAHR